MNYEELLNKLRNDEPFSFSRWGDGEWACMLGKHGENCDGHKYFNTLGFRLTSVLQERPQYTLGLQEKAMQSTLAPKIHEYMDFWQIAKLNWVEADVLHKASMHNKLDDFIEQMERGGTVLIAPAHVAVWFSKLNNKGHIVVIPEHNCWCAYESIKHALLKTYAEGNKYYYCASMMSNVLIDDMYNMMGDTITQIDCGSVFDPYAGKCSRRYHSEIILL